MYRLIRIGSLWCLAISIASAQEADTSKDEANQHNSGEPQASASSKAIVLVIDADAQKSDVVKEVIAALEKAGIATDKAAETAPPTNSSISVTLNMRKDESHDKIKQLVEALKRAGVQQMSIREGGVRAEGEEEQNTLILDAQPGHATDELPKIENGARYAAKKCGLSLVVVVRGREGREEGDWSPKRERTQTNLPEPVNLLPGSTQAIGLRQAQAQLRNAQLKLAKLRLQYSDQHPSVKALELEIQAMESQLQPREELLATLQGVRSELVKKNEAARTENGSQNTETARLETLIAELDDRIKSIEGVLEPAPEKMASVKVFALKYAQATDAAEVLKQVYDRGPSKIVPDARTNSVIVTGPEAQVQEIEALLMKLDRAESEAGTGANLPAPVKHIEYTETHPVDRPGETSAPPVSVIPVENEAARLLVQLKDELAQLKQSFGPKHPKVQELQTRIEAARKSPANTTITDASFLSPTDAVQWNLMASEIALELKKDLEAFHRLHGPNVPRVNFFDDAIDSFKELNGALMFADETAIAELSAEMHKKYQPLVEKGPEALRAERDRLIEKNNTENDEQIVELQLLTAWATVKQRYRDRNISAQHGVRNARLENVIGVNEESGKELQQQLTQLRKEYEAANQQAQQLGRQLQQSPDDVKKADLQQAVQRAFTLRQSLLRAELIEMQSRLLQTQRSLEMRERISDQIIQRRVEDLLNPELKWDNNFLSETTGPITSTANASRKLATTAPVTELEGEWHLVAATDAKGKPMEFKPTNLTFKMDQYTLAYQGGQIDRRGEVYPDSKEIRYFKDDSGFVQDRYLLEGDQLTIYDENRRNVFQRDHVALPKSIPAATDEQKSLLRSGIVEIMVLHRQNATALREPAGYGVVVSPQGLIVSQLKFTGGDWVFFAKFDDGGLTPIKLVEECVQGWVVFQPERAIVTNHHYRLSAATVAQSDEVHFWGRAATVGEYPTLELGETTVNDLDRKAPALGQTVWQLFCHDKLDGSLPVMDSNGDLLAITLAGTNDLLLAVPVSQLKTMFPKSLGPAVQEAE